jgi:hypothetical protein
LAREGLVSDIPSGDGKTANLFLQWSGAWEAESNMPKQLRWMHRAIPFKPTLLKKCLQYEKKFLSSNVLNNKISRFVENILAVKNGELI